MILGYEQFFASNVGRLCVWRDLYQQQSPHSVQSLQNKRPELFSYSLGHLALGNLGNTVYWLYVISVPFGPVWLLQAFFSTASALILFCYLHYEKKWFWF